MEETRVKEDMDMGVIMALVEEEEATMIIEPMKK